jgi:hypothetical protein
MPNGSSRILYSAAFSVAYSTTLAWLVGIVPHWGRWFSEIPYQRQQVEAFFHFRLDLSQSISDLNHDLVWSNNGVHQVWGLGIPLWRLPFDALWKMMFETLFPDRLATIAFISLAVFLLLRTSAEGLFKNGIIHPSTRLWNVWSALAILLLFPPLISLLGTRGQVWEDVLVYVYFYGITLASQLLAFLFRPSNLRFISLCLISGMGGLIRPTLAFYGLATVITAFFILWGTYGTQKTKSAFWFNGKRVILAGLLLYAFSMGSLLLTNFIRFGSSFEFGHKLNLQPKDLLGSVYATRFDFPFQEEPLAGAGRELFGALFMVQQLNGWNWYADAIFKGQSPTVRWREFYFTTYDLSYLAMVLIGWAALPLALLKFRNRPAKTFLKSVMLIDRSADAERITNQLEAVSLKSLKSFSGKYLVINSMLASWSFITTAQLVVFYFWTPAISSRYMMDFSAAFAVAIVVCWWQIFQMDKLPTRLPLSVAYSVLIGWLAWEFSRLERAYTYPASLTWNEVQSQSERQRSRPLAKSLLSSYVAGENMALWQIPYNGEGWARTGEVNSCVILFADSPAFLELELEVVPESDMIAKPQWIQAKVGLELLKLELIESIGRGWRVRFAGPKKNSYKKGIQPVFIATVPKESFANSRTPWILKKVSWRK